MAKNSKALFKEIHENASRDRQQLENFRNSLLDLAESCKKDSLMEDADDDPVAIARKKAMLFTALAEGIAKISDCLTRSNMQMVEVAKLKLKKEAIEGETDGDLNESDKDDLYDDIGEGLGAN